MSGDPFDVGSISTHHTTNKVTSAQPQAPQVGDIPLPPNPYEDTVDIGDHAVAPTSDSAAALEEAPEESPTSAGVDEFIGNAQQEIDRIRAYLAANSHLPTEVRAFYKRALKQLKLLIKDLQQGQLDIQDHLKLYKKYLIQARNLLEQLQAEAQFQGVLQLQGDARQALRLYDNPGLWEMVTESERQSLEPLFEILREYKEGELGPIDAQKLASALNQLRSKLPPVLHRIQGFLEDQMVSEIDNLIEYLEGLRDSVDENATAWYAQVASWNPSYAGIGLGNAQGGTTPYNFNQNTQTPESCDSLTHLIDYLKKLRGKIISGEISVQDYKAAINKVKNHPAIQGANNDILAGVITKLTYSVIVGSALAAIAGVVGAGAAAVFAEGYTGSAFLGFLGQMEIMGGIFALGTEAVPALGMSLATGEMPFEGETAEDITQEVGWSWGKNIAMVGFFHGLGSGLQALAGATQEAYPVLSSVISSPLVRHPLMYLGMVGFGLGEQTAWEGLQWFSSHGLEGNPGSVWTWSNVGLSAITTIPAYLGLTAAGSVFGPELILSGSSHGSVESNHEYSVMLENGEPRLMRDGEAVEGVVMEEVVGPDGRVSYKIKFEVAPGKLAMIDMGVVGEEGGLVLAGGHESYGILVKKYGEDVAQQIVETRMALSLMDGGMVISEGYQLYHTSTDYFEMADGTGLTFRFFGENNAQYEIMRDSNGKYWLRYPDNNYVEIENNQPLRLLSDLQDPNSARLTLVVNADGQIAIKDSSQYGICVDSSPHGITAEFYQIIYSEPSSAEPPPLLTQEELLSCRLTLDGQTYILPINHGESTQIGDLTFERTGALWTIKTESEVKVYFNGEEVTVDYDGDRAFMPFQDGHFTDGILTVVYPDGAQNIINVKKPLKAITGNSGQYNLDYLNDIPSGISEANKNLEQLLFEVGADINAKGTGKSIFSLISIALDGRINPSIYGDNLFYGKLMSGLPEINAGEHGPFFVILEGEIPTYGGIGAEYHRAYLVPNAEAKIVFVNAVMEARDLHIISPERAMEIITKIKTYAEFIGEAAADLPAATIGDLVGSPEFLPDQVPVFRNIDGAWRLANYDGSLIENRYLIPFGSGGKTFILVDAQNQNYLAIIKVTGGEAESGFSWDVEPYNIFNQPDPDVSVKPAIQQIDGQYVLIDSQTDEPVPNRRLHVVSENGMFEMVRVEADGSETPLCLIGITGGNVNTGFTWDVYHPLN